MSWEYLNTTKYQEAIDTAKNMGWKEKVVQIRVEFIDYIAHYYVEPWEKDCKCPHILKYGDHFKD